MHSLRSALTAFRAGLLSYEKSKGAKSRLFTTISQLQLEEERGQVTGMVVRLFKKFYAEVTTVTTPEIVLGALLFVAAFLFKHFLGGGVTWQDLRSVLVPSVGVGCVICCFYLIKAAWHLHKEDIKAWADWQPAIAEAGFLRPKRPSPVPVGLLATAFCAFFVAIIGVTVSVGRESAPPIPVPTVLQSVFFNCETVTVPIMLNPGSSINVMHVPSIHISGMGRVMTSVRNSPQYFGASKEGGGNAYRCELRNDDPTPIFKVSVPFKVIQREVLRGNRIVMPSGTIVTSEPSGGKTSASGRDLSSHEQTMNVERIGGSGDFYQFYFWNGSDRFIQVTPPSQISAEVDGVRRILRLKVGRGAEAVIIMPKE